jgi:hypothetical protein
VIRNASNTLQTRLNELFTGGISNNSSLGFAMGIRLNSTTNKTYFNKVHLGDLAKPSVSITNSKIIICGYWLDGSLASLSPRQYSCAFISKGLSSDDVAAIYDPFQALMTKNGKEV